MKWKFTYDQLLEGFFSNTFGNSSPSYMLLGPITFESFYRWFVVTETANARSQGSVSFVPTRDAIMFEEAKVIPIFGFKEGCLQFVTPEHPLNPAVNGTIYFEEIV